MNHIQHYGFWSTEFFLIHKAVEHPIQSTWGQALIYLGLIAFGFFYARYVGGLLTDIYDHKIPGKFKKGPTRLAFGIACCIPVYMIGEIAHFFLTRR